MTVTSIGSSFSYIRPERAAGGTTAGTAAAAEAQESKLRPDADADGDETAAGGTTAATRSSDRPAPLSAVSDELKAALLRLQEDRETRSAKIAALAYGSR